MYRAKVDPAAGYIILLYYIILYYIILYYIILYYIILYYIILYYNKPFTLLGHCPNFPTLFVLINFQHPYTITVLCLSNRNAYQEALASSILKTYM